MKLIFADSSYFIALTEERDAFHAVAVEFSQFNQRPLLVTDAVILELGAHFCKAQRRPVFAQIMKTLAEDKVEMVGLDAALMHRALALFARRADKDWSLADCASFLVMKDRDIIEAATADEHFEQAGFVALLRPSSSRP